jgi:hypothetical protein
VLQVIVGYVQAITRAAQATMSHSLDSTNRWTEHMQSFTCSLSRSSAAR